MELIRFENVSKTYPLSRGGVFDLNFKINQGEFVYLIGSSGAGKSTIINLLIKNIEPDSGKIRLGGIKLENILPDELPFYRRNFGIVSEKMGVMPNRSVFENVAYPLFVQGKKPANYKVYVEKMLASMGIGDISKKKASHISGGERARLLLARALITNPALLIADEPTAGLDNETAWDIMGLLDHVNHQGTTILMATHQKKLVNMTRKRVIWIKNGKIASDEKFGRYRTVYSEPVDFD